MPPDTIPNPLPLETIQSILSNSTVASAIKSSTDFLSDAINTALPINNARNTTAQENITFPSDLLSGDQKYYIQFRFQKYQKRSLAEQATKITVTTQEGIGALQLPIPNQLVDAHSANYSDGTTSFSGPGQGGALNAGIAALSGAAIEQGIRTTENFPSTSGTIYNRVIDSLRNNTDLRTTSAGIAGVIGSSALAAGLNAPGNIGNASQAIIGITTNPFMSLLYQSPNFKSHQFSWRFIPRTPDESENIRKIIRTFQYHMLPTISQNYILFGYPSMAIITLAPSDTYLYKFKPCVITSFTANYAPGNTPSFYKGGKAAPAAVEIFVNLREIEYWTAESLATATGIQQSTPSAAPSASIPGLNAPAAPGSTNQTPGI